MFQQLPNETLQQYYARLMKLRQGGILGTQGMMDRPIVPTVEQTQITEQPLGQVVMQDSGEDNSDPVASTPSMTPEEIIQRQAGIALGTETPYKKVGAGFMVPLGGLFAGAADAYERQAAEYQLGKMLGETDRNKAIELGASYFDDTDKLQGLLSDNSFGLTPIQTQEDNTASEPSIVGGLFSDFLGGAMDFLGITRKEDEPKPPVQMGLAPNGLVNGQTQAVPTPPTFQAEDNSSDYSVNFSDAISGLGSGSVGMDEYQQF